MKISELRALGAVELKKKIEDLHQELFNLKLRAATRQLASNREIPRVRRDIARINTILKERELGIRE